MNFLHTRSGQIKPLSDTRVLHTGGEKKINCAKKSIFFEHLKPPTAIERDPVVLVEEPIKWREL